MAISKPLPVPKAKIVSVDVPKFDAGLFLGDEQNAPINSFVAGKDIEIDRYGSITQRRKLTPFLPDTVETTYQKFPVLWNGVVYYFTADDNKIKFCQVGDTSWTDCGGTNTIVTQNGGYPVFQRVLNNVVLCNGTNGDKLCWADLTTMGFDVVKLSPVDDPATDFSAPTLTGLTSGALSIYYAYSYNGAAGETLLSNILTVSINIARDQWQSQTTPASILLTLPETPPTGAESWNVYIALAATGGSITDDDMLQVATGLDLNNTTFLDDGSLSINLGQTAPTDNSTDGPRVDHVIVEDGNPIFYGDFDNPYNIWIGGSGLNALKLTVSNGGYNAQPELGTNYYPSVVVGFRNGQGIPSLTVLYSNTEGLSKQAVLQQQQVNYGDQSFTVWGTTEQHYGAAGVAAPNSPINCNGKLAFLSTDGFLNAETQASIQNVLAISALSGPIDDYVRQIKNSAMKSVVGAGWNNKFMWCVPNAGFDTPQQILILDTNNKGVDGHGAWDTLDIPAQWIGVISPQNDAAFVYISQGNKTYKLIDSDGSYDNKDGISVPFSTGATGARIGMGGQSHNEWMAGVQAMFYVIGLIGTITVGVTYWNQGGKPKTKTKTFTGPVFVPSSAGGWGDTGWSYANLPGPAWSQEPKLDDSKGGVTAVDKRIPVQIDDNFNEAQWFFFTPVGFNKYKLKSVSYEGINLGVRPDLA